VRRHVVPKVGAVRVQAVTRAHLKAVYQRMAAAGLAKKSVHNAQVVLYRALQDAVDDGLIPTNPAERAHTMRRSTRRLDVSTADEVRAFLASTNGQPLSPMWRLALMPWMRRGELLGLRWRDIDLASGVLSVRQARVRGDGEVVFGQPKSGAGSRSMRLDGATVAALANHQRRQARRRRRGPRVPPSRRRAVRP